MKINKAVYTYFNNDGFSNPTGFNTISDMAMLTSLSIMVSSEHFDEIEFNTNMFFAEKFNELDLPISITTDIEDIGYLDPKLWAYSKIHSYSLQTKPFVHIDNDVILWEGLPKESDSKKFIMQSKEKFETNPHYYRSVYNYNKYIENKIEDFSYVDCAYNCGVLGIKDMDFNREYTEKVFDYVGMNYDNIAGNSELGYYQNHFFEQYILSMLIHNKELKDDIFLFGEEAKDIKYKYSHLWSTGKRAPNIVNKVYKRVKEQYPDLYEKVLDVFNV